MEIAGRVLFVFWEGYLDVSPTVLSLVEFYERQGYETEVVLGGYEVNRNEKVSGVRKIDTRSPRTTLITKIVNNNIFSRLFPVLAGKVNENILSRRLRMFSQAIGVLRNEYEIVFCIDATGLFAFSGSGIKAKKLVYLSLEILEAIRGSGSFTECLKENEMRMLENNVDLVIIQDQFRKAYLERTIGFLIHSFAYLPNSSPKGPINKKKDRYFHDLFGIPAGEKIILSAGMISESVCSMQIAKSIRKWQNKFPVKVIFHERMYIPGNASYYKKVAEEGGEKLLLSLRPVPYADLEKIFSSADVGLAIYNVDAGDNFGLIGSASGKLFQYIKYGLPVIASALPGLRDLVEENDFGIIVKTPEEIPGAIEKVFLNYNYYSSNAKRAFDEKLNIDLFLSGVYNRISA